MTTKTKPSTIEQIRKAHGPRFLELKIPEWAAGKANGSVPVVLAKRLSAPDYILFQETVGNTEDKEAVFDAMVMVVQVSFINPDGTQLIGDDDLYLLTDHPNLVTRVGAELMRFNGLSKRTAKNSASTP